MAPGLDDRFRKSDDVHWTVVDGEAVLIDLRTGRYFTLNTVASSTWQGLVDGCSLSEISQRIEARFEVQLETARDDLLHLVDQLVQRGLIETDGCKRFRESSSGV